MARFRRPELHRANKESGDVALLVKGEAREPPTSEFTIDISPGRPTLGTEVQSPGYTVSEEATVGEHWAPDCRPALPAPVLGESRADQTWSSPEGRCAKPAHDTVHDSHMRVACYEYPDMINSFQTLIPACGGWIIPGVHGGRLITYSAGPVAPSVRCGCFLHDRRVLFGRRDLSTQ